MFLNSASLFLYLSFFSHTPFVTPLLNCQCVRIKQFLYSVFFQ